MDRLRDYIMHFRERWQLILSAEQIANLEPPKPSPCRTCDYMGAGFSGTVALYSLYLGKAGFLSQRSSMACTFGFLTLSALLMNDPAEFITKEYIDTAKEKFPIEVPEKYYFEEMKNDEK